MDWKELSDSGWNLLDVEEVAVALSPDGMEAIAFDPEPRKFPAASAIWNGAKASPEEFAALIESDRAAA